MMLGTVLRFMRQNVRINESQVVTNLGWLNRIRPFVYF
jgi:hypothetical protein